MIDLIMAGIVGVLIAIGAFYAGKRKGSDEERWRCEHLLLTALNVRFSPTAREAAATIAGRQTEEQMIDELLSMNETTRQVAAAERDTKK